MLTIKVKRIEAGIGIETGARFLPAEKAGRMFR